MIKKLASLLILLSVYIGQSAAQSTNGFHYQAVARDNSGVILANENVNLRFQIKQGMPDGMIIYQEKHSLTTNQFGLIQTSIGAGSAEIGDFSTIAWANDSYYLTTELNGAEISTSLFEDVPYAKVATSMDLSDLKNVDTTRPQNGDALKWDGRAWRPTAESLRLNGTGATTVSGTYPNFTISSTDNVNDADASTTNEIQSMALSGNTLSLSLGGGSVSLASFASPWINSGSNLYFNTGKVGIGDNSPVATLTIGNGDKLQIHGSDGDVVFKDDQGSLRFANSNGSNSPMIHMFQSGTNNSTRMLVAHSANFSSWGIQYNDTADAFNFIGDNEPVFQVQLSGQKRVGLGTYAPQAKLHVNANSSTGVGHLKLTEEQFDYSRITMNNNIHDTYWDIAARTDTNLANAQFNVFHQGVGDIFSVNARRRVGINDATPGYPLEVNGNGQSRIIYAYNTVPASTGNSSHYGVRVALAQSSTTGNPRLYTLYGSVTDGDSYLSYGVYGRADNASNFNYGVYGRASTNDGYAVYASGNTYSSGSYLPSDQKLKSGVKTLNSGLQTLLSLSPKSYRYDTQAYKMMNLPTGEQFGFLAQDIERVLPNLVKRTYQAYEDESPLSGGFEFKALNYTGLIPVMVSAIQEQQEVIEGLETKVESLEKRLEILESLINK